MSSNAPSGWDRDVVVGIVGAIVLVSAMAGALLYERGQFTTYDAAWGMVEAGTMDASGTLEEGESATHTIAVAEGSLARVRVTLAWTEDVGDPDTFDLEVAGPDGAPTGSASSDASPLEAPVEIVPEPATGLVTARSEEAARALLQEDLDRTTGHGTWTITVTLADAPGQTVGGVEGQADGSNAYEVEMAWDTWEAQLVEHP